MPNRDIGIDVTPPKREPAPGDQRNPFNGSLPIRGSVIVGTVVTAKMQSSCVVEKEHQTVVPKYERIEKRARRYPAHVPSNIDVAVGDEVVIAECRPISKTVSFVVVENRGNPSAIRAAAHAAVHQAIADTARAARPKVGPRPKAAPRTKTVAPSEGAKPASKKAAAPKPAAKAPTKEA